MELGLAAEDSTCSKLCGGTTVTNGLNGGLHDDLDVDESGTGDEGTEEELQEVLTDEKGVLLAWEAPDPEVPRGLPAGSRK